MTAPDTTPSLTRARELLAEILNAQQEGHEPYMDRSWVRAAEQFLASSPSPALRPSEGTTPPPADDPLTDRLAFCAGALHDAVGGDETADTVADWFNLGFMATAASVMREAAAALAPTPPSPGEDDGELARKHDVRRFIRALADAAEIVGSKAGLDIWLLGAAHLLNHYAEQARVADEALAAPLPSPGEASKALVPAGTPLAHVIDALDVVRRIVEFGLVNGDDALTVELREELYAARAQLARTTPEGPEPGYYDSRQSPG